ncbi:MAG: hypothetical protein GY826_39085 [Fuerstiella sp.]|nr:hypothetical protein [Fuerstiella sp.]
MNADNRKKALGAARNAVKSGADRRSELPEYFWHRSLGDICLKWGEVRDAIPLLKMALTKTTIEGYLKDTRVKLAGAEAQAKN